MTHPELKHPTWPGASVEALDRLFHELRRPLASIQAHTELLADEVYGPLQESQKEGAERVRRGSVQLTRELQRLYDLWTLPQRERGLRLEDIDVFEFAAALSHEMPKPIAIGCPIEPALALANREALASILDELLSNACTYAGSSPIRIDFEQAGIELLVQVRDEGPGIPYEDRERVLEAFQRGTPRGVETVKGLGIGVPLARLQAEAMGACLDLNAGPGCWWTLRLRTA